VKKERVELLKEHTDRGAKLQPGAVVELRPSQAKHLYELGVAKPAGKPAEQAKEV
jgi:hypothetical protein